MKYRCSEDDPRVAVKSTKKRVRRSALKWSLDELIDQVAFNRLMELRNRAYWGDSKRHRVPDFDAEFFRLLAEAPPEWRPRFALWRRLHYCQCEACCSQVLPAGGAAATTAASTTEI